MAIEERIKVDLGDRGYEVVVRSGLIQQLEQFRDQLSDHVVVVSDRNVADLYLPTVVNQLQDLNVRTDSIIVEPGENSKSIEKTGELWNKLLELHADRHSIVIALGGGVVGDLGGFAAATYGRGVQFIQIPTSLLAQVDSSVGGKTGINLPGAKNMVGAFWQPKIVLIDPDVLSTLDDADYRSGLAEVVKYGVIMDSDFFGSLQKNCAKLNSRDREMMTSVIAHCCRLKSQIVMEDETETSGRRAILNYGHTFGHAIENVFEYGTYLHGEAVAIGMQCAARTAGCLELIDDTFIQQQTAVLTAFNLPLSVEPGKEDKLVAAMHRDKKISHGKLRLILPTRIGHVELFDSPGDEILKRAFTTS